MVKNKSHSLFVSSTRNLCKVALVFLCAISVSRAIYYSTTKGFSLKRTAGDLPSPETLVLPPPSSEVLNLLTSISQRPFRYLAKGSQAYAFLSDDGKYVLKLFKFYHLQSPEWLLSIPLPQFAARYRNELVRRRKDRIVLTLNSYKIASERLQPECGLIYTQILPSTAFSLPATLKDANGRVYTVDLAQYGFTVQKKISLVLPSLEQWIQNGQIDTAKNAIDSLVSLITSRSRKGVQDLDPDLHKNAGLIGTCAVHIDIGSFFLNPDICSPEEIRRDSRKIFSSLHAWLKKRSPELTDHLESRLSTPETMDWVPPTL